MKPKLSKQLVIRLFGQKKPCPDFNFEQVESILIRPLGDAVGDAVINLAYARQLKDMYPNLKLGILVTDRNKDIFAHSDLIDELIEKKPANYLKHRKKWQLMLDFEEQLDSRSIIAASVLSPDAVMIFKKRDRKYYSMQNIRNYDFYCPYNPDNHVSEHLCTSKFAEYFTIPQPHSYLSIPEAEQNQVVPYWQENGSRKVRIYIAPQGSVKFKRLPENELAELLNKCDKSLLPKVQFVMCNSKNSEEYFARLKSLCDHDIPLILSPKTSLPQYVALTASSDIVIGVDSGTVHLACALSKPLLSFYTSHNIHSWSPLHNEGVPHLMVVAESGMRKSEDELASWTAREKFPLDNATQWLNAQISEQIAKHPVQTSQPTTT
ncbi:MULTISPECIES: glycosyltransferase family 9 protein [unclassified Neisseria]|uniref:glycosyltransferase family 9 protein n=1 Tax=unclassified Neisseria TaxID=2623750 RepID=UPI00266508CC|nr:MULTISPECIES: glycosyltransferase family 9 protein [unclassified Neisseria]MDO1509443.1 glycosyltransferase family 9 protein [Neisseria sp. MVDL19-042950]MDO1515784.1 glycosyltransferase family 9 protein [Neisseria sp. MVDL18-041461]MDO1563392.1 glycosyltransferase family 9 protein [Neisseria sp. MVDL20-010259]